MNQPDYARRALARKLRDEEGLSWAQVGKRLGCSASCAWCLATAAQETQTRQTLRIRLRSRAIAKSLAAMYELTRRSHAENSPMSLEAFVSELIESQVASYRLSQLPPPKVFDAASGSKDAFAKPWLGVLPDW
jgi:predicted transcriptional regulator